MPGQPKKRELVAKIKARGGLPWILDEIADGATIGALAPPLGVSRALLSGTLNKIPGASDAICVARAIAAQRRIAALQRPGGSVAHSWVSAALEPFKLPPSTETALAAFSAIGVHAPPPAPPPDPNQLR
jgi:hypothetical protein